MAKQQSRTIFIGDVHGCLTELRQILKLLNVSSADRVILLGDLINRGPDSLGVVKYVIKKGYECILGNHEDHYLRKTDSKHYPLLKKKLGPKRHRWIKNLPLYIESEKFLAVHAGLQPDTNIDDTPHSVLLNIRTWDGKGINLNDPKNPPWYTFYRGRRSVFYGHWASQGLRIRLNTIGLDSGCVYGGALSAYILETKEVFQVAAARTYCPSRFSPKRRDQ